MPVTTRRMERRSNLTDEDVQVLQRMKIRIDPEEKI